MRFLLPVVSLFFCAAGLAADTYNVKILRTGTDSGTLTFQVNGVEKVNTPCWFNPQKKVAAKTYTGCSATTMETKKHHSIYLPKEQTAPLSGIFIHVGGSAADSDGCIVIAKEKIELMYDTITPKDGKQVTVVVADQ